VGEWLVEPEQSRVVRGSESRRLDARAIAVLSFLARHPNDVVTKLLTKLRSLTNLRVVEDPSSRDGWKVQVGPFPGWKEVPTW
jgi:DNA-binding response OmpR family regulator